MDAGSSSVIAIFAKFFMGLGVDQVAPDHSTLSVFRERILAERGPKAFDELHQDIVGIAKEKGISLGPIQIVDAIHSLADADVKKDDERKEKGEGPRDKDASWVNYAYLGLTLT